MGGGRLGAAVALFSVLGGLLGAGAAHLAALMSGAEGVAVALAAAAVTAVLGAVWVKVRILGPTALHLETASAFIHHDPAARADAEHGGRGAREVARTVNALIEHAIQLEERGRFARRRDIETTALAIAALGQGSLRDPPPRLAPSFRPVSEALTGARRELVDRMAELHETAAAMAAAGSTGLEGARALNDACVAQQRALAHIAVQASESVVHIEQAQEDIARAIGHVVREVARNQQTLRDLRTSLTVAQNRSGGARAGLARAALLAQRTDSLRPVLETLNKLPSEGPGALADPSRFVASVRDAQSALDVLPHELRLVQSALAELAQGLNRWADDVPGSGPEPRAAIERPLTEASEAFVRAGEITARGLREIQRGAHAMEAASKTVFRAWSDLAEYLPTLTRTVDELRMGTSFDDALIERLERAARSVKELKATPGHLSSEGEAMVSELESAAAAARARVDALVAATDATLAALRS